MRTALARGFFLRRLVPVAAVAVTAMLGSTGRVAAESPPPVPLSGSTAPDAIASGTAATASVADQFIVRFVPSTNARIKTASLESADLTVRTVFSNVFPGAVVLGSSSEIAALRADPQVASVERDSIVSTSEGQRGDTEEVTTQVVQPSAPWGLDRIDQRNQPLSGAYDHANAGSGVDAYVIDTGMRVDHSQFTGRVGWGAGPGGDVTDCNGHGTHVAGTIGGSTYGVAKQVTLIPVKVLDCGGSGTASGLIAGLDWVMGDHSAGTPAVANMSLGFSGTVESVDFATQSLIDDGVTVVVAAGNSAALACDGTPAHVGPAVTVGATDISDGRASFSNYGSCVDLFAPGVGITSAWITSSTSTNTISGTSMASPHVAGAAAVALTLQPGLSPGQVASKLVNDATLNLVTNPGSGSPNRLLYITPPNPTPAPANDNFTSASAFSLSGSSPLDGTNVGASAESGEPNHANYSAEHSVWWRFTAPTSGFVELSTRGSSFDTVLGVYTGTSVSGLTEVASNDDNPDNEDYSSLVEFGVEAGVTYRIAIDGFNGSSGVVALGFTWWPDDLPDTTAPISSLAKPSARWTLSSTVPAAWSATDSESGVASYDVARRSGAWNAPISPTSTVWLPATTATSQSFTGTAGSTYCLKARARDFAGNLGGYNVGERCTAIPLRSDQLTKSGTWTKSSSSSAYGGFYYRTTALGAKVTRTGVVARRIALVATRCSSCGSVKVFWNGVYQKTVALTASGSVRKQAVELLSFATATTGTLTLEVSTAGKAVIVEGLAISKSSA